MSAELYVKEVYKRFKYHASWEPGNRVSLGDFGTYHRGIFTYVSNLKNLKINFDIYEDQSMGDLNWTTQSNVAVTAKVAGDAQIPGSSLGQAEAGVHFSFSGNEAVVSKLKGVVNIKIDDQLQLAKDIAKHPDWKKNYVIITEMMEAKIGTVIVADGSAISLDIKASGNLSLDEGSADIADAQAGFSLVRENFSGTVALCENGITPYFKLKKYKQGLFRPGDLVPFASRSKHDGIDDFDKEINGPYLDEVELEF